jgi:hypothetical protein
MKEKDKVVFVNNNQDLIDYIINNYSANPLKKGFFLGKGFVSPTDKTVKPSLKDSLYNPFSNQKSQFAKPIYQVLETGFDNYSEITHLNEVKKDFDGKYLLTDLNKVSSNSNFAVVVLKHDKNYRGYTLSFHHTNYDLPHDVFQSQLEKLIIVNNKK